MTIGLKELRNQAGEMKIFPTLTAPDPGSLMRFHGDIREFFEIVNVLEGRILYAFIEDTSVLGVGFLHNERMHVSVLCSDSEWIEKVLGISLDEDRFRTDSDDNDWEKDRMAATSSLAARLEDTKTWVTSFFKHCDDEPGADRGLRDDVQSMNYRVQSWLSDELDDSDLVDWRNKKVAKSVKNITKEICATIRQREDELAERLPSESANWAMENGLKRLTLADFDVFLSERDISISYQGKRKIWQKANFILKKS